MKDDGYKIRDEFGVYYLTFVPIAMGIQWVDVFSRKAYIDIALNSLKYCRVEQTKKIRKILYKTIA